MEKNSLFTSWHNCSELRVRAKDSTPAGLLLLFSVSSTSSTSTSSCPTSLLNLHVENMVRLLVLSKITKCFFHAQAYCTCWEKPLGCCCIVTVIFSCQEVPACSDPGLLPACLMVVELNNVGWIKISIPLRGWVEARRTADAGKELLRRMEAGEQTDGCDKVH